MFCQDPADSFSTEVGNIPHLQTQSKTLLQSVNGNNSTKWQDKNLKSTAVKVLACIWLLVDHVIGSMT